MKLKIQFVAVPSAAPFVRIASEFISVGYTSSMPLVCILKAISSFSSPKLTPRNSLHADTEEDVVQEEEGYRSRSDLVSMSVSGLFVVPNEDGDEEVAKRLAGGSKYHHVSAAPSFHVRDADQREEQVGDTVACGE
jgi:hypothetical protein